MKNISNKFTVTILYISIAWVNLYKFVLIRQGFLTEPDERRYLMTWIFLKHLLQGDWQGTVHAVFSAQGRPASILLHSIPAGLQFISAKIRHLELFETQNFDVVFVYNLTVNLITLYVLYRLFQLIFNNKILSLTGILFYSVLVNNFSYLRHIYPYDESLLLFIYLVYRLVKAYMNKPVFDVKFAFWTGSLAFLGFLIYPAYYLSFMAVYILFNILIWNKKTALKSWLTLNSVYIAGSVFILLIFEALSRFGQASYLYNIRHLSGTVNQGDYKEAYSFIVKYFWQVEHFSGLILLAGIGIFSIVYFKVKTPSKKITGMIVLSFLIPYLIFTTSAYFLHNLVMMGRILHQFVFVIIIMNVFVLQMLNDKIQKYVILTLTLLLSIQFYSQIQTYLSISYPRDVYWKYLKTYPFTHIKQISEYDNSWSNLPQKIDGIYINPNQQDSIIIVNGQYFFPVDTADKYHSYQPENYEKLIFNRLHFINYKAYQFEAYKIKERALIDSLKLHIRVYQ